MKKRVVALATGLCLAIPVAAALPALAAPSSPQPPNEKASQVNSTDFDREAGTVTDSGARWEVPYYWDEDKGEWVLTDNKLYTEPYTETKTMTDAQVQANCKAPVPTEHKEIIKEVRLQERAR